MNLIEFKRLCQLKQNYDYIFVNAEETEGTNASVTSTGTVARDSIEIKPDSSEKYVTVAGLSIMDDNKVIEIEFTEKCNEFVRTQIMETVHIVTDSQYRYYTIGQIQHKQVINVTKVGFDEFYHMHLGLIAKNEIVINLSRFSFMYQLILNQLTLSEGKVINNIISYYINKINSELVAAPTINKFIYATAFAQDLTAVVSIANITDMLLYSLDKSEVKASVDTVWSQLITISYTLNDKFLTKLNVTEVGNKDVKLPITNINTSFINIGRKSLLSDYSHNTLFEMSMDEEFLEKTTLEDINYIII